MTHTTSRKRFVRIALFAPEDPLTPYWLSNRVFDLSDDRDQVCFEHTLRAVREVCTDMDSETDTDSLFVGCVPARYGKLQRITSSIRGLLRSRRGDTDASPAEVAEDHDDDAPTADSRQVIPNDEPIGTDCCLEPVEVTVPVILTQYDDDGQPGDYVWSTHIMDPSTADRHVEVLESASSNLFAYRIDVKVILPPANLIRHMTHRPGQIVSEPVRAKLVIDPEVPGADPFQDPFRETLLAMRAEAKAESGRADQ